MRAKKFKLFLGCLGNGTTVCNKAVMENGDYKYIAFISPAGNIKFYVDEDYIPPKDMEEIRKVATADGKEFRKRFEQQSDITQYGTIVDTITYKQWESVREDKRPISEKLPELRELYYSMM